jgi:serine/threonine-protein kinase
MKLSLKVVKGEDLGDVFQVQEGETKVFGRGSRSDIVLRDVTVSRQHARVRMQDGIGYAEDLGSRNGIILNGKAVKGEVRLSDRDFIDLGQLRIEVRVLPDTGALPYEAPPMGARAPAFGGSFAAPAVAARLALRHEPADLIGSMIGGCRIERYIGGEAAVHIYRAIQVSMERAVALKLLLPEDAQDDSLKGRFLTAARIGGRLSHPNIIQIYDAGEEEGVYFVALEYVGNATLRNYLGGAGQEKPLDQFLAAQIAEQLAAALDCAHAQGIVHGRISPEHIMLTPHGMPKLADLGVAALGHGSADAKRPMSLDELCHVAPEQADGSAPPSPLGDLYSLGAVLYTMLAGHPAFRGESAEQIVERIRKGECETLTRARRDVSKVLAQVAMRAMSANPEERFARAADMQAALLKAQERL